MTRYGIDARAALRIIREGIEVPDKHQLVAPNLLRSHVLGLVYTELHGVVPVGDLATIEGVSGRWRVDPAQLDLAFEGRTSILSPFDRLMTDPHRVGRLFEFDYTLEMYKPARSRMWGQFALPILHGDRLVGKVDARSDRDSGRFIVNRVHEDVAFDRATRAAVDEQIDDLAAWLRLERSTA